MAKPGESKAELIVKAERLYVQERRSMADVAKAVGRDERTIRTWASEGNWVASRDAYAEATGKTHEKLYRLVSSLTDKAIESCESGTEPSQSQLYFIAKMAPLLLKLKTYEEEEDPAPGTPTQEKPKQLSDDIIDTIEATFLGLQRKP